LFLSVGFSAMPQLTDIARKLGALISAYLPKLTDVARKRGFLGKL